MSHLESLDAKHHKQIYGASLPSFDANLWKKKYRTSNINNQVAILNSLFSAQECNNMLQRINDFPFDTISQGTESKRERSITFCPSLEQELHKRLQLCLPDTLLRVQPYGKRDVHNPSNILWHSSGAVNPCFRVIRYDKSKNQKGVAAHRDAQYVASRTVCSSCSVVLFLTDGGKTDFLIPNRIPYNGCTVEEELKKGSKLLASVPGKKGRVVVFDQRLLHVGYVGKSQKIIVRTDLLSCTRYPHPHPAEKEASFVFRQAQLLELDKRYKEAQQMYERAISLRAQMTKKNCFQEKWFKPLDVSAPVLPEILFESRSALAYHFGINQEKNDPETIKLCYLVALLGELGTIDEGKVNQAKEYAKHFVPSLFPERTNGDSTKSPNTSKTSNPKKRKSDQSKESKVSTKKAKTKQKRNDAAALFDSDNDPRIVALKIPGFSTLKKRDPYCETKQSLYSCVAWHDQTTHGEGLEITLEKTSERFYRPQCMCSLEGGASESYSEDYGDSVKISTFFRYKDSFLCIIPLGERGGKIECRLGSRHFNHASCSCYGGGVEETTTSEKTMLVFHGVYHWDTIWKKTHNPIDSSSVGLINSNSIY